MGIHIYIHTKILLQLLAVIRTWQSQDACALSRQCEPCKQSSWSRAMNSHEKRPFLHSKWCGYPNSHLDHCCFMRKSIEFVPQQMPGPQSQLGGLVGGRWKIRWKIAWVGLELGPQALSLGHNHYTTQPPHIHTHIQYLHTYLCPLSQPFLVQYNESTLYKTHSMYCK